MNRTTVRRSCYVLLAVLAIIASACRGAKKEATPQATATATGTGIARTASDVGVTADQIVLGSHFALTGPAASYAPISKAAQAYFEYVNTELGGVNGRKIVLKVIDDAYDPSKTVAAAKQLVDQEKVFALFNGLGTPTHSAVYEYLNEQKVPDLYVATGAAKWNDPKNHPYTFGYPPSYPSEAEIFANYYQQALAGKKVGILYQNDDFGKDYLNTFVAKASGAPIVGKQSYEATATDVSSQLTALKGVGAEVLLLAAIPKFSAQALKNIHDQGWKPTVLLSYVSADPSVIKNAGVEAAEGVISAGYLPQYDDAANPDIAFHKQVLSKYAPGLEPSNFTVYGVSSAQMMVETLKRAGINPTRASLLQAAESVQNFKSMALGPATMTPNDHTPLHCERLEKVVNGKFVYFGELICAAVKP